MPGLSEIDKRIRLWLVTQKPSLAKGLEDSNRILKLLDNNTGLNPAMVANACYKQFCLLMMKDSKVRLW